VDRQKGVTLTELVLVFIALAVLGAFLFSQIYLIDRKVKSARCESNLRKIGTALHIYANEESDQSFPKDDTAEQAFRRLFVRGNLTDVSVFDCPFHPGSPSGEPGPHLKKPGISLHEVEYLYNREDHTLKSPATAVLVTDKPGSHGGDEIHILTADGKVHRVGKAPAGNYS
jgi:hypothetical protein